MSGLRAAAALILATWLIEGAGAQQAISGAPAPAGEPAGASDAEREGDRGPNAKWLESVRAAQRRHDAWLACVTAKRRACSPAAADPMELLLNDDTLVNGDIVSTPHGLKVFRGRSGAPHSASDFE
jgi:hypothetical protein